MEAHALTVLEKNYFKWVFDLTYQRGCTDIEFKLEYEVVNDLDQLFKEEKTIDFYNNLSPLQIRCNTQDTSSTITYDLIQSDENMIMKKN